MNQYKLALIPKKNGGPIIMKPDFYRITHFVYQNVLESLKIFWKPNFDHQICKKCFFQVKNALGFSKNAALNAPNF